MKKKKIVKTVPAILGTILLVDDDPILRSEFVEYFSEYKILEAASGEEALKWLSKANSIDLVILDYRMSGMTGLDVLKKIREKDKDIGVIIFTGYGSKEVVVDALRNQVNDFIEKPMDVEQVRKAIEKIMNKKLGCPEIGEADVKEKMEAVKQFVRRNVFKKVYLKDAADCVGLSPKYLSRVFEKKIGEGFNEYKCRVKIEKSKELLLTTGQTVAQVSYKIAYENTESFIRTFKKLVKMTPSEFRRKNREHGKK